MKAVSLFSGGGGFEIGFERAGIETVLQAEIDPVALSVLARHWPETARVNDVRNVGNPHGADLIERMGVHERDGLYIGRGARAGGIDLVFGGFPCQDLSVAGKRAGLAGERSGLFFEFARVVSELRPRWLVAENVLGLLSSNQGRDFGIVLDALDELGYGLAWAVLDAQHFGVPQRRRRVFIVGCLGDAARAAKVLSVCESCGGDSETGGETDEGIAAHSQESPDCARVRVVAPTLDTHIGDKQWLEDQSVGNFEVMRQAGAGLRRFTPREAERLMGWPDDWTRWNADGKELADIHRYRLCGNGVVAPCAEWIGRRLVAA